MSVLARPNRAWPMRAQGGPQGPSPQGPSPQGPRKPTRAQGGPQGPGPQGHREPTRAQGVPQWHGPHGRPARKVQPLPPFDSKPDPLIYVYW